MSFVEYLGFCAAFCTTIAFLPQAIKVIRTRDTSSLSLAMYAIFNLGVALWLFYGLLKSDIPIIVANVVTLLLALGILCTKIYNDIFKPCKNS
ncbi:MAG: SemiSWEET family sugar transporter [Gammaproteobacteria bacterium]|nr:SemiSWEET family sugar transporter [Gammaproteobacteria bacterium]